MRLHFPRGTPSWVRPHTIPIENNIAAVSVWSEDIYFTRDAVEAIPSAKTGEKIRSDLMRPNDNYVG
ncbi:hypothetical protein CBM2585_B80216 [Cupriavidus taiwanensis]|nr:hypothetical protein CBM2585_B80216 [Cupriavidus taiwanensis]